MTGVIALIVALTGLLGALGGLIALFRKVQAVHVLVNSQLSAMMQRVDQLTGVLQGAGLQVPDRLGGGEAAERPAGAPASSPPT
jgi:hypothetical protein